MTLTDYLAHLAEAGRAHNTIISYANDLADFAPTFAGLRTYVASLDGFKRATRARKIASARSYCRWLADHDAAPERWSDVLVPVPMPDARPSIVPDDALARLLAAPTGDGPLALRDRALLRVLADTGCRVSELVGLGVGDVLPTRSIAVGVWGREVPISEWTALDLAAYLAHGRPLLPIRGAGGALFVNHRGARLSRQGCWLVVQGYCRDAGIPRLSPADLRHAAAARFVSWASRIQDAQELMGHASPATTMAYRLPARRAA